MQFMANYRDEMEIGSSFEGFSRIYARYENLGFFNIEFWCNCQVNALDCKLVKPELIHFKENSAARRPQGKIVEGYSHY